MRRRDARLRRDRMKRQARRFRNDAEKMRRSAIGRGFLFDVYSSAESKRFFDRVKADSAAVERIMAAANGTNSKPVAVDSVRKRGNLSSTA